MTSSSNVVKTTNPAIDDLFLCRAFANVISSDKLLQVIHQQPAPTVDLNVPSVDHVEMTDDSPLPSENTQWKMGDSCLCPYSEDGLMYKATIINIDSSSCTVSFDDYGNEEIHVLTDLQIRTEDEQQQQQHEPIASMEEHDIVTPETLPPPPPPPPPPPFPVLNPNDDNDTLSATLMSWYLAGYHTGFYQGLKNT